jgi:hypothetical protein
MRRLPFHDWLRQQAERDDKIGEVARYYVEDACAPRAGRFEELEAHFQFRHDLRERLLNALKRAIVEWRELGRAK